MYVRTDGKRNYYKCDKCGRDYSFKVGVTTSFESKSFCREHVQEFYPEEDRADIKIKYR